MTTIEKKIQKKVDEINKLIALANLPEDTDVENSYDGKVMVVDTSSTWEEPAIYEPIVFRNGVLYIEYFEPYSNRTKKEKILKRDLEYDGYGTLLDIAKMYKKALKRAEVKFEKGGMVYRDLFEDYENQPEELAEIVSTYMEKFEEGDYDYDDSKRFLEEVESVGYTFDYGLDNEPYGLRPIGVELSQIQGYEDVDDDGYFKKGGVTENYVSRKELNTITIKKGNQKLTYKISDVLNGAYKLESGAKLEDIAFYVPKRNIVKVQLKTGKDFKPANGYWIKDGAKPIHVTKFDDGGEIKFSDGGDYGKVAFEISNNYIGNLFLGFYNLPINGEFTSSNAFMRYSDAVESLVEYLKSEDGVFVAKNYPKSKFEIVMVSYNSKLDKYKDFEPQRKVVYSVSAKMVNDFIKRRIFEDGGKVNDKIKIKDLVNKRFDFEIGSGSTSKVWNDEDEIIEYISQAIKHNLFDYEFYYNWTDNEKEYLEIFKKDTLEPLLKNIDKTLNDLFFFEEKPYPYGNKLKFKTNSKENENWIDNWFKTNKSISQSLKKDYYDYRNEYAGVKLLKGGKVTFKDKARAIAKNFKGKRVEPKYQKEYGKVYDKAEAKEVGNKIAGSQKAKYDAKAEKGAVVKKGKGNHKMKATTDLARKIRKEGEKWTDAIKRASQQLK